MLVFWHYKLLALQRRHIHLNCANALYMYLKYQTFTQHVILICNFSLHCGHLLISEVNSSYTVYCRFQHFVQIFIIYIYLCLKLQCILFCGLNYIMCKFSLKNFNSLYFFWGEQKSKHFTTLEWLKSLYLSVETIASQVNGNNL